MKPVARILAAQAAVFLAALAANAQDVSTPAPPAKPTVQYVEGRGIVFRSPDSLFEASLGFNLQVRFSDFDFDPASTSADADEFRVRRFKLFLSGFAFDPRLTWRFQAAFETTAANRLLDDAWLNWKFSDAVSLQGGQYKTPFSRDELYNDGVIQFPERALATDTFKPSRDVGVMLAGGFWKNHLAYQAGVFGGDGQNSLRATEHVMPMLRLVWNAFGDMGPGEADLQNHQDAALSLGAAGFHNTLKKSTDTGFEAIQLNYTAPAGWLGRNVKLFTTGEDVSIQRAASRASSSGTASPRRVSTTWARRSGKTAVCSSLRTATTGRRASSSCPVSSTSHPLLARGLQPQHGERQRLDRVRRQQLLLPQAQPEGHVRLLAHAPAASAARRAARRSVVHHPGAAVSVIGVWVSLSSRGAQRRGIPPRGLSPAGDGIPRPRSG